MGLISGKFITLEGGEGVGKSTLVRHLADWFKNSNIECLTTREPGGTPIADEIRRIFKTPPGNETISPETEALLVSAARSQHVSQIIRPALKSGKWVLCDRFADSTRVYQGALGGVHHGDLEWLIQFSTAGLEPDLTFYLDCDVEKARQRINLSSSINTSRDDASRFDQAEAAVHERIRQGFRKVAGFYPGRYYILDAAQDPLSVFESAVKEISRRWLNK